jgi:hypothetical protein
MISFWISVVPPTVHEMVMARQAAALVRCGCRSVHQDRNVFIGECKIAILSYVDTVSFGVTADYASFPDLDVFTEGIECGLVELSRSVRPDDAHVRQLDQ